MPSLRRLHHEDQRWQLQPHELHRVCLSVLLAVHAGDHRRALPQVFELASCAGFSRRGAKLTACCASQSLRMYLLGQEAMVANPQGSVAGGHVARSTGGHLPHSGPRHPGHHCGDPNLHGSQGSRQSAVPPSSMQPCSSQVVCRSVCCSPCRSMVAVRKTISQEVNTT